MSEAGFDWPALMRAGLQGLGLTPDAFWRLTPAELLMMLGDGPGVAPMGRARLEALAALFPDVTDTADPANKEADDGGAG